MTQETTIRETIKSEPHHGQRAFHRERLQHRWRALLGGTGSGKTYAGVLEVIYWCLTYPGVEGVIFEPTFGMIKRNILPLFNAILGSPFERSPFVKSFNKGDMVITWNTDPPSKTWMGSLEYPERAEGQSLDYIHADELRLVRYVDLSLKVMQRRLRGSAVGRSLNHPIGAWITTTPDEPLSDMHMFLENPDTRNPNSRIYRMSLFDNQDNLPLGYVSEVVRAHTGGEYDRFILGLFAAVVEGILRFDYSLHVVHDFEADGETWLVDESNEPIIPRSAIRSYNYGHDFGWTEPAAQIAIGWDNDNRAYALDEFYQSRSPIESLIENAFEFQREYGEGAWYCDASEPRTIERLRYAEAAEDENGIYSYAYKGKREDGIRELGSRLERKGDSLFRLYVHRRCVNLISELQSYDPKQKTRDHAVDALRYGIMGGKPVGDMEISFGRRPY